MMQFLLLNVFNDSLHLTFAIRKSAIAFLPIEMTASHPFSVDPRRTVLFNQFNQISNRLCRTKPD